MERHTKVGMERIALICAMATTNCCVSHLSLSLRPNKLGKAKRNVRSKLY